MRRGAIYEGSCDSQIDTAAAAAAVREQKVQRVSGDICTGNFSLLTIVNDEKTCISSVSHFPLLKYCRLFKCLRKVSSVAETAQCWNEILKSGGELEMNFPLFLSFFFCVMAAAAYLFHVRFILLHVKLNLIVVVVIMIMIM